MTDDLPIRQGLIENATDSLLRAIQTLAWDDHGLQRESKFKQSVQLTAHGIELILKAKLHQIHPALAWENVDRYPDLDARTVGSEQAMQRLERIGGLIFSQDDKALLRSLRRARNAIEHMAWEISEHEANVLLSRGISFALSFTEQLGVSLIEYGDHKDGLIDDFLSRTESLGDFSHERQFSEANHMQCPACRAHTLSQESRTCRICGYAETSERTVAAWDEDDIPF